MKMHQYVVNKLVLNLLSVKDFSDALDKLEFEIGDDVVSKLADLYVSWVHSEVCGREVATEKLNKHVADLNKCVNYMIV